MAFINNTKLQEIRSASRGGNEKAAMVIQALRKGQSQEDLDRLVNEYYGINASDAATNMANVELENPEQERPNTDNLIEQEKTINEPIHDEPYQKNEPIQDNASNVLKEKIDIHGDGDNITISEKGKLDDANAPKVEFSVNDEERDTLANEFHDKEEDIDFEKRLDGDLKDVLTENKLDDVDFGKFLKDKANNATKSQRNADYFKAYDPTKREAYLANKIQKYSDGFNGKRRNAERKFNDMSKSLELYSQNVNDMLDDTIELDLSQMNNAYNDFVNNEDTMASFGRYWDNDDSENIKNILSNLVQHYGKKNIQAMLNTLTSDANNYKSFLDNQVDTEVNRYSKDIEKLLK